MSPLLLDLVVHRVTVSELLDLVGVQSLRWLPRDRMDGVPVMVPWLLRLLHEAVAAVSGLDTSTGFSIFLHQFLSLDLLTFSHIIKDTLMLTLHDHLVETLLNIFGLILKIQMIVEAEVRVAEFLSEQLIRQARLLSHRLIQTICPQNICFGIARYELFILSLQFL